MPKFGVLCDYTSCTWMFWSKYLKSTSKRKEFGWNLQKEQQKINHEIEEKIEKKWNIQLVYGTIEDPEVRYTTTCWLCRGVGGSAVW